MTNHKFELLDIVTINDGGNDMTEPQRTYAGREATIIERFSNTKLGDSSFNSYRCRLNELSETVLFFESQLTLKQSFYSKLKNSGTLDLIKDYQPSDEFRAKYLTPDFNLEMRIPRALFTPYQGTLISIGDVYLSYQNLQFQVDTTGSKVIIVKRLKDADYVPLTSIKGRVNLNPDPTSGKSFNVITPKHPN